MYDYLIIILMKIFRCTFNTLFTYFTKYFAHLESPIRALDMESRSSKHFGSRRSISRQLLPESLVSLYILFPKDTSREYLVLMHDARYEIHSS